MGSITITPDRAARVDFTVPVADGVREVVVSGPAAEGIATLEDLAGREVWVRRSSSYWQSLDSLDRELASRGLDPVQRVAADENLETEDLLEMVAAGLVPLTISDDYLAEFWAQVFPGMVVHEDLAVAEETEIGWAVRRTATGLKPLLDEFVAQNRQGTMMGNLLLKRYLGEVSYVENALASAERRRFEELVPYFRRYASEYDFEFLLVAAQGFQESRLDQSVRSPVGAVGVMQLLPSTAADPNVGIPDISTPESNIHAGIRYLRFLSEQYLAEPELDATNRQLLALAAYNAGPTRLRRARAIADEMGLDPNVWFQNVERAMAAEVGSEPVRYVRNIFKYYTVYKLAETREQSREQASRP